MTDYVIVGGGSAGCVLANRLSENSANSVVLLEAGGASDGFMNRMPAGGMKLMFSANDWCHVTEPDPSRRRAELIDVSATVVARQ